MSNQPTNRSPGVALIAAERARQVESEGYTTEHDAEHGHMQLAQAGTAYALGGAAFWWPWDLSSFKPTHNPVRDLTKAGALIAAAIDAALAIASREPAPVPPDECADCRSSECRCDGPRLDFYQ